MQMLHDRHEIRTKQRITGTRQDSLPVMLKMNVIGNDFELFKSHHAPGTAIEIIAATEHALGIALVVQQEMSRGGEKGRLSVMCQVIVLHCCHESPLSSLARIMCIKFTSDVQR